ncbi:MAG: hypothetical protein R3181_14395 [Rubricoccaceae bacterium]|nr:hypothetical protein [Rubricoccaceae bacterium]
MRPPLALLVLALLLAACDTGADPPPSDGVTFEGVAYTAVGDAELERTGSGLVVRRGPSGQEYGVRVDLGDALDGPLVEADFRVAPVDLPANSRWGLQLFGDVAGQGRTPVATVWSDAVSATTHVVQFDFGAGTGVETLTLEYYLEGRLQLRVPAVPLVPGSNGRLALREAGEGDGEPESVHVVRDGTRYVVATDYGGSGPRTGPGGCGAALLRLAFPGIPDVPSEVCTDYVRAIPDPFENVEAVTSVEIRARTLDEFTLVDNDLE